MAQKFTSHFITHVLPTLSPIPSESFAKH